MLTDSTARAHTHKPDFRDMKLCPSRSDAPRQFEAIPHSDQVEIQEALSLGEPRGHQEGHKKKAELFT